VSLPTLSTSALNIGDISILRPTQVDAYDPNVANIGQTTGVDTSNQYAALDAETRVDQALQNISSVRAQLGAEVVATQGDQQNADNAAVQMQASQSNIADLNVGSAVTDLTRAQILNQVGTSVLSQFNFDQLQLAHELIQALIA
jgi:flagellin-like hook-associated protein FlgL